MSSKKTRRAPASALSPSPKRVKSVDASQSLAQLLAVREPLLPDKEQEIVRRALRLHYFPTIAQLLLNKAVLTISSQRFRLVEIEFYYCHKSTGGKHRDLFAHQSDLQLTCGKWYFHRSGKSYKGGSYKGLDITLGNGHAYGGILIRSIEDLDTGEVVDGPCMCVNKILELTNHTDIASLVGSKSFSLDVDAKASPLRLTLASKDDVEERAIFTGPRVGLTLKRSKKLPDLESFVAQPYRFVTAPENLKKHKFGLGIRAVGLALQKRQAETESKSLPNDLPEKEMASIARELGMSLSTVRKYVDDAMAATKRSISQYKNKSLNVKESCGLLGAAGVLVMPDNATPVTLEEALSV